MAEECSYSESGVSSHDKVDMRGEEGICSGSISNIAHQIPLDLTYQEILTRLPTKSIKRFQCVSKEWLFIIQSQVFINKFSSISKTPPRFIVAVRTDQNRVAFLSTSNIERKVHTASLVTYRRLAVPSSSMNQIHYTSLHTNLAMKMSDSPVDLADCSSVHGLFSLSFIIDPGLFKICNPRTRQLISLPAYKPCSGIREDIYMFLGYDSVSNEYKALCSAGFRGQRYQEHKVLTLGGRSDNLSWRDIDGGTKITCYTVATNKICINGIVYCGVWTTRGQEKRPLIVWFNVRDEKIGYIRTYSSIISGGSLINFNGRLAAACRLPDDHIQRFTIYILHDEYEFDKIIWTRIPFYVDSVLSELSRNIQLNILGMNKTDEFVLCPVKLPPKDEPLYIYYYKSGMCVIRRVELDGFEKFGCKHKSEEICDCQILISADQCESLVSS